MKMKRNTSKDQKYTRIEHILHVFGMTDIQHTTIDYLSGGERRKLNVATEFLTDPYFLLCDEPTTGLDSFNALTVIKSLKDLITSKESQLKPIANKNYVKTTNRSSKSILNRPTSPQTNTPFYIPNYVAKGIACSIHQPSSELFQYFTHVILMNSGRIVFQGSTKDATIFFST